MTYLIIILIEAVLVFTLIITLKAAIKRNSELKKELNQHKKYSKAYYDYISRITEINNTSNELKDKINKAENDEEILDIVGDIVNDNNSLSNN